MKKLLILFLIPFYGWAQIQSGSLADLPLVGASGLTATVNNILPNGATSADGTDMSGYGSALVQIVSTATGGTFIFEGSNFLNTNYQTIPVWNQATATGTPITAAITATVSQIGYWIPKKFRYIRCRIVTTVTGGTLQAVTNFTRSDADPNYFQVAQATAANLNATVTGTVTANIGTGSIAAGSNAIGDMGVQYRNTATGAGIVTNVNSPATPAVQTIKASAGRLIGFYLLNRSASSRSVKVFNATAPTLGITAAAYQIGLPANMTQPMWFSLEGGISHTTAITICVTGADGLTDNTSITLGDITGFLVYQ